jgi:rod shape determining protein RodA
MTSLLQRRPDSGLGNIRSSASAPSRNIDWLLLGTQALICAIGLATVYSASYSKVKGDDSPFVFVQRQEIFMILAVILMVVVMSVDYDLWRERAAMFYVGTIMLLMLVIAVGAVSGGARLSFDLGPFNVQPAEFAKVTLLMSLSAYLAEERAPQISYARFSGGLVLIGIPAALIIVQPDLGSASVIIAIAMGVLLVGGARFKHIALITALALMTVGAAVIARIISSYQLRRVTVFLNSDLCNKTKELYDQCQQVRNSTRAVATGGILGKGWLQGPITNSRTEIPVQWADFPFSAIGEQFGLVGGAVLLGLYGIMLFRIFRIAQMSRDTLGTYLCAGAFTMILWQVFQNVGMTIGIMPVTGLPLPFISYGGSGLLTFFALMGLVQNVHMRRYR